MESMVNFTGQQVSGLNAILLHTSLIPQVIFRGVEESNGNANVSGVLMC